MEKNIPEEISKKINIKEKKIKIMFEIFKNMGYNIKDFNQVVEDFYKDINCY